MTTSSEYDLCVIGGGLAGMTAATRAAQAGLRVVVLEQGAAVDYLCNSRMTGGAFHVCLRDIQSDAAELEEAILKATRGAAHPALARAISQDARKAVKWLQSQGIRFIKGGAEAHHNFVLSPPSLQRVGSDWKGRGGDVLLRTLESDLQRYGGRVLRAHRAKELKVVHGRCAGVTGRVEGRPFDVSAANVVIADGGYQCDMDLMREHISPRPDRVLQRNARSGLGDGVRMAMSAGARLSDMVGFYGHLQHRDALINPDLWPTPWADNIATSGIVIDGAGRRFADEGRGGVYLANRVAALADPLSATVVFDRAIWEGPGTSRFRPANPFMPQAGGKVFQADTVQELARAIGVPAVVLEHEVAAHNKALEAGLLEELVPTRSSRPYPVMPIASGPFFGIPVVAGITYTMGGVAIDEWARALTADGQPFPGLYAAGGASGGLEGGEAVGYVGGLSKAATTGLRAAEQIIASRQQDAR
jgi:fumarate reductase flavoprotein subunit